MIESKEDLSFTVKFGDREMIFNPGSSETIKRESSRKVIKRNNDV